MSGGLTNWERLVIESGSELSPAKLNDALDKRLAYVTSNLALIATLAAGFGLFSDLGGALREDRRPLQLILALLLSSVVISVIGSAPNWWRKVDVNDPDSIENYYRSRYVWRSWAARIAIALFTLAVVLTGLTVWNVVNEQAVPAPQVNLRYAGGAEPAALAAVTGTALPPREEVTTVLVGCAAGSETGCPEDAEILAVDVSSADSHGKVDVELTVTPVPKLITRLEVRVKVGAENFEHTVDTS